MDELLKRSALLLVDCQNDFIDPPAALKRIGMLGASAEDRVAVVNMLKTLLEAARRSSRPIFHVRTIFRRDLADCLFTPLWKMRLGRDTAFLTAGSLGAAFIYETGSAPGDVVITTLAHSAFQYTRLDLVLSDLDLRSSPVAGCGGVSGSVDDTVRQGAALGYDIAVIMDAVFPLDPSFALSLKNRASIQNTKEIVERLTPQPDA